MLKAVLSELSVCSYMTPLLGSVIGYILYLKAHVHLYMCCQSSLHVYL